MRTKLLILLILTLSGITIFAQDVKVKDFNDFDIAKEIIGKKSNEFIGVLNRYEIEYWITQDTETKKTIFIHYNESIRAWDIKIGTLYRGPVSEKKPIAENIVLEVFVKYRHFNLYDLKDFNSYNVPDSDQYLIVEKKGGVNSSHLRLVKL